MYGFSHSPAGSDPSIPSSRGLKESMRRAASAKRARNMPWQAPGRRIAEARHPWFDQGWGRWWVWFEVVKVRWEYHLGRLDGGSENLSWWLVSKNGLHKGRFDDKQWKSIAGRVSTGQLKCWGCISSRDKCTEIFYSHYPNNSCMVSLNSKYNWSRSPLPQKRYAKYVGMMQMRFYTSSFNWTPSCSENKYSTWLHEFVMFHDLNQTAILECNSGSPSSVSTAMIISFTLQIRIKNQRSEIPSSSNNWFSPSTPLRINHLLVEQVAARM